MRTFNTEYLNGRGTKIKLTNLDLHRDSCGYYLTAKYRIEDDDSIRDLDIPKIRLRVNPNRLLLKYDGGLWSGPWADIGFGLLELSHTGTRDEIYFTETVLEEKFHEMTLEEIEKKLGHKVKIVTKEN